MVTLRRAVPADADRLVPSIQALNVIEGIVVDAAALRRALDQLLADDALGRVWWIEAGGAPVGHAVVTFGFDLEFAGRDAFLTELYLEPAARGRGVGQQALGMILAAMPALEVRALHLGVKRENARALALYRRAGFTEMTRAFLTRIIT